MRVRRLALLSLLTLMAPAVQAWPSGGLAVNAVSPGITLLSTSQWSELVLPGVRAYHLVGEVRNDAGANVNVSDVTLNLNLLDGTGQSVGHTSTVSSLQMLRPGESSPFEAILFPAPTNYASFTVSQPIPFVQQVQRPDHGFITGFDACPNPNPASADCQYHMSGSAQNPLTAPPAHRVSAILSFYNASHVLVGQDRTDVVNAADGSDLAPGEIGHFSLDRTGEPAWTTRALVVEPQYPVDINPMSPDFGNQRLNVRSASQDVTLTNNGDDAVTIASAAASGDFAVASLTCTTIAPGSSCRVNVTFRPTALGVRSGTLTLAYNAAGTPAAVPLKGVGVAPMVSLDRSSVNFGSQAVGTTSGPQNVTLTNTGTDTLDISSVSTSGDFSTTGCPATVDPSDTCVIAVSFAPTTGGTRNGTLTIRDDAAGSPHTVSLTGIGLGPGVAVTPNVLDFGEVNFGSVSDPKTMQLKNSGSAALAISDITSTGDFSVGDNCPRAPITMAANATCTITVTFTPTATGVRNGTLTVIDNAGDSPQAFALVGIGAKSTYSAVITTQAVLRNSDGQTWLPVDPALSITLKPTQNESVALTGNADLWTATPGVNQDLGVVASIGGGADTLLFWKESGGFAGTFSPNAAFVHGSFPVSAGFTYVFKLVWKANHEAPGSAIYAGAGPIGADFSPTRLTAQLVPASIATASITTQPQLSGSDGQTWTDVSSALQVTFSGSLGTAAVISGNADLWTATSGINQDLAIFITPPGGQPQLVAWKESGGSAGTFSPNAAFVRGVASTPSSGSYRVSLKWKTNVNAPGATIFAGAGPISGRFSPTTLTVQLVDAGAALTAQTTRQQTLTSNDGVIWSPLGSLSINRPSTTAGAVAVVGANADLWTDTRGYNQDIGIFLSIDNGPDLLIAWKESGGFAGVFSPNAAFVQAVVPMPAGHAYTFKLKWKTNRPEGSAMIAAGAGPIGTAFSPTSLGVQLTSN